MDNNKDNLIDPQESVPAVDALSQEDVQPAETDAADDAALQNTQEPDATANEPADDGLSDAADEADASAADTDVDDESKPRTAKERIAFPLYDLASIVGTAVIAIMVVFTFFFRFVGVVGPSMQPTLFEDDWLAVAAIPREPQAGDIVIVTQPNAFDEPIVKRVVATAGQTVDIREGHVFIDGKMLTEKYISPEVFTEREDLDNYPLTVPEGEVFVLGDNRPHSTDSRSAAVGMIDCDYVLGRVSFRIMPFGKWKVNIDYEYPNM